jgi:hypothetical protein
MDKMDLGTWLAERVITEDNGIDKVIAIYPGRFQPFGKHHKKTYDELAKQFGKENTFIATADNIDSKGKLKDKSPFTFAQKKQLMTAMGVPADKIIETNPYRPVEITNKFDADTTAVIFAVGEKDMRDSPRFANLDGVLKKTGAPAYYKTYKPNEELAGLAKHGYVTVAPHVEIDIPGYDGEMSGTALRQVLATADEKRFEDITGISDPKVYAMVQKVLASEAPQAEQIERFIESYDIKPLLKEISSGNLGGEDVDDGPRYFYGNNKSYEAANAALAKRLGYTVINYLNGNKEIPRYNTAFPNGPTPAVSFFPVGIDGAVDVGTNYFKELKGKPAYNKWKSYINNVAQRVGYKFLNFLGAEDSIESSAKEPTKVTKVTPKVIIKDPIAMDESATNKEWWNEQFKSILKESKLLTEGGAAGHMAHPFDDNDLTFEDLKELVRRSLAGELDLESAVSEKTDGQNLQVTFKDGQVGAARNKSTIINPMSIDAVEEKFKGRGDIEKAFVYAMQDLEKAILAIPEAQREKIFQNGRRFVNLEIIYPATQNVISYGPAAYLQFHGLDEFDETGKKVKSYPDEGNKLQKIISKVNADTQEHFKIIPPNVIQMQKDIEFDKKVPYYINKINKIQKEFGLPDKAEVSEYHEEWWTKYINENIPEASPEVKEGLIRRWALGDKSFRLNGKNIPDAAVLNKAKEIDKTQSVALGKKNIKKFEEIFLELGADVMRNITNYLAVNPAESVKSLRKDVAQAIKAVKDSNDLEALNKLQIQLQRIERLGGFDKIVPSEGIVFVYKGKTYKYTGAFAPVNQLLGLFRYSR